MRHVAAIVTVLLALAGLAGAEDVADPELAAKVPALVALHEVVAPLWHEAYPERDLAKVRELLPALKDGVAKVEAATLPGILRDKAEPWRAGVASLVAATAACERSLAAGDVDATLAAVEEVHARFEALVRTVRPRLKELETYHVALYPLVHRAAPARSLEALRSGTPPLVSACEALVKAQLPSRMAAKAEVFASGASALCAATARLAELGAGADLDATLAQLDAVHTQYQALEHALD